MDKKTASHSFCGTLVALQMLNRRNKSPLPNQGDVESLAEDRRGLPLPPNSSDSKRSRRLYKSPLTITVLFLAAVAIISLLLFLFLPYSSPPYKRPTTSFPVDSQHVSVVIMNHSRPRMIRESKLMTTLTAHPAIDEILLCHANERTKFVYNDPKVKNVDAVVANQDYGLSLRFHYCRQASNDVVLHVDDDMELSAQAIDELLAEFHQDNHRIVGKYGRAYNYWRNWQRSGYDTATIGGPAEVVLTKILVLERTLCDKFFEFSPMMADVMVDSTPLWNGEDIFVNLVANHVYGVPPNGPFRNFAIRDLAVWEASDVFKDDDTGEHDVSGNMDRHRPWNVGWLPWWRAYRKSQKHAAFRGRLWYTAKERLAEWTR